MSTDTEDQANAEDAYEYDNASSIADFKKAHPIPRNDKRGDGREAFGMVPISLTCASGVEDRVKTLFALADKLQGDYGRPATGYRHTAETLNWSPMTVKRTAEKGRDYGLFNLVQRVPPNGKGQPEIMIQVIHNPSRGRVNPDLNLPPNKVLKSLETPPPQRLREKGCITVDSAQTEGLYHPGSLAVSDGNDGCSNADTAPRSMRSKRSIGEEAFDSASQPSSLQNAAREISAQEFQEIADKLFSDLEDLATREQILEIRRLKESLALDNEMMRDRIAMDCAVKVERSADLTQSQAAVLIASMQAEDSPPTVEPDPIVIPRKPTVGAYRRKPELVGVGA